MSELDPVIHPINRLRICATLNAAGATQGEVHREMKFATLRDHVGVSDATLSKQLSHLESAGYVHRNREYGLSRDRDVVWVQLTQKGKAAYDGHVAALREIAGQ
ncbi:hypothetical protein B841_12035 [Corynebacterium maris DSM 45190]|uniref:Winged helix DNA-binding domain-containing protein n=1 Tax=Corynebacterium maris DSM 45190 TaxID=1224163 RepID=S5SXA7_9CORY|nr:transcriptional regulator [Corynebacterium maris]AGS35879.1 hypothetical protein B841_12035 [Corynebacterium maris DSM 45190]